MAKSKLIMTLLADKHIPKRHKLEYGRARI
ncbi:hypothetical protein DSUL_50120 [Desulfovibrionales bacterium]